jgi:large conductance mechanosensitive channel protein
MPTQPQRSAAKTRNLRTIVITEEELIGRQVSGFVGFLREKAVVGQAVAFVVATQVQSVVKQFVSSFLDPLTQVLFGATLSSQKFVAHDNQGQPVSFMWGQFVYVLIDFFVVVLAIYVIIKVFKLDKFERKVKEKKHDPENRRRVEETTDS